MKKLVIISLDLLVALPILTLVLALLFSSVKGTQAYLPELGLTQEAWLRAAVASQLCASRVDLQAGNMTSANSIAAGIASSLNVSVSMVPYQDTRPCGSARALCRLVTVSGHAYLLVVSYEGAG